MGWLKKFLNSVTMYRLMLYYLLFLWLTAIGLSYFNFLVYQPLNIFLSGVYLVLVCILSNKTFAHFFKTKPNLESRSITALILTLIIGPVALQEEWLFLTIAAVAAMASKYVFAFKKHHLFNPAAFGVVFTSLALNKGASWWVGNEYLLWFVILGGLIMIYKIRRFHLVGSFLVTFFLLTLFGNPTNFIIAVKSTIVHSPFLFFAFVMLGEPLTSPQSVKLRTWFGVVVATAFMMMQKISPTLPYPLELSLLVGNVFARIVNPQIRLIMRLNHREQAANNTYNFWFDPEEKFAFVPGQFLEYTLPHTHPDSRGVRRFFSIASSPPEGLVLLSTKVVQESSTYKKALANLKAGAEIIAANLAGDFVLPPDQKQKLAFIAGGIGITPFRSMIKYLVDKNQSRDIVLLYSVKQETDLAFRDVLDKAKSSFGLKTAYVITDRDGFIDETKIKNYVPDWEERIFYVSGPEPMVQAFEKMLGGIGLPRKQIKRDYFPGYTETHQT